MVLALATALFLMPASTAYAASNPTLVVYVPGVVSYYDYRPDSYHPTGSNQLIDITDADGDWVVPANKSFLFLVDFENYADCRLTILRMHDSGFDVVVNSVFKGYGIRYNIPSTTSDAKYRVLVTPQADTYIYGYGAYWD